MKKHFLTLLSLTILLATSCSKDSDNDNEPSNTDGYLFSVSPTTHVYFSSGNLQYNAATEQWRFAEHQYDYIGEDNLNNNAEWIDLFGWNSGSPSIYYNVITSDIMGDGGNWRVLTLDEWHYLCKRTNKSGVATVAGTNGVILIPDGKFEVPDGLTFNPGVASELGSEYYKTLNEYSAEDWAKMEANGAVFMPASGYVDTYTKSVKESNIFGYYWCYDGWGPSAITFSSKLIDDVCGIRNAHSAVRLVRKIDARGLL